MSTIKITQDVLLTVTPRDANGGATTVIGNSLLGTSSNLAAFENAFLDPPNQSEAGRTSYTLRAKQHGKVGDKTVFHVTANAAQGTTGGALVEGSVPVDIGEGTNAMPPAVSLGVVATGVNK